MQLPAQLTFFTGFVCLIILAVSIADAGFAPEPKAKTKEEILKLFADEFVSITPGKDKFPVSFKMGSEGEFPESEKPIREIKFAHSFAIAKYEVTQELYEAIIGKNPSTWKGPRNSVEMIDWNEATQFCEKATAELRDAKLFGAEDRIRLPSEAEWEYACRAGTATAYSFGDDKDKLKDYAWFNGNAKDEDPPVGKKKPNDWGLYDMHGYIWEWCLDSWHDGYAKAPADGGAWTEKDAKERIARGGSWGDGPDEVRSAFRGRFAVDTRSDRIGFRCVKERTRK